MRYLKTFEALTQQEKEDFIKMNAEPNSSFNLNKLREECIERKIVFFDLVKEMVLDKKIAFHCDWCYNSELTDIEYKSKRKYDNGRYQNVVLGHNIIGQCIDISQEKGEWCDRDIVVRINDDEQWHTLFAYDEKKKKVKKKVRIYNYTEGPLANELNMYKNADKYNL